MQIHHIGYGIRGFYKLAKLGQLWDMIPNEAQKETPIPLARGGDRTYPVLEGEVSQSGQGQDLRVA